MTQQRSFKARVRERMSKTGERYAAARAQLLRRSTLTTPRDGVLVGYQRFGGVQSDTAIVRNMLAQADITDPLTGEPITEEMVFGLCGGPGFLYALFEYQDTPPLLTMTMRNKSMPDVFIEEIWGRCGLHPQVEETTSPRKAARTLDEVLDAGRSAICTVDMSAIPYYHVPEQFAGMSPHLVGVAGRHDAGFWLDDRSVVPRSISAEDMATARATYRKARHRLISLQNAADDGAGDAQATATRSAEQARNGIIDAVARTVYGYRTGDVGVPAQFRRNCGFDGLAKWRDLLRSPGDRKGWRRIFPDGELAYLGLRRVYDCINLEYTAPAAGRPFYADFLDESAASFADGRADLLGEAAGIFRESGARWQEIADIAARSDSTVADGCEVSDRFLELLDSDHLEDETLLARHWSERLSPESGCRLTGDEAATIYDEIAESVDAVIEIEQRAVGVLESLESG